MSLNESVPVPTDFIFKKEIEIHYNCHSVMKEASRFEEGIFLKTLKLELKIEM